MNLFRRALALVKSNRKAYIIINVAYYGLVIIGMVYVIFNPGLQKALLQLTSQSFEQGPLQGLSAAYTGGKLFPAIALTFAINLLGGSLLAITLPSLFIPFAGFVIGIFRAVLWGLLLSPANAGLSLVMIPHSITLILEGQGYILALLAAFIHGKSVVAPKSVGASGLWEGYKKGLKSTALLYILVVIVLLIAAIYEAVEVILMMHLSA
jgi:hypothetical protein